MPPAPSMFGLRKEKGESNRDSTAASCSPLYFVACSPLGGLGTMQIGVHLGAVHSQSGFSISLDQASDGFAVW